MCYSYYTPAFHGPSWPPSCGTQCPQALTGALRDAREQGEPLSGTSCWELEAGSSAEWGMLVTASVIGRHRVACRKGTERLFSWENCLLEIFQEKEFCGSVMRAPQPR